MKLSSENVYNYKKLLLLYLATFDTIKLVEETSSAKPIKIKNETISVRDNIQMFNTKHLIDNIDSKIETFKKKLNLNDLYFEGKKVSKGSFSFKINGVIKPLFEKNNKDYVLNEKVLNSCINSLKKIKTPHFLINEEINILKDKKKKEIEKLGKESVEENPKFSEKMKEQQNNILSKFVETSETDLLKKRKSEDVKKNIARYEKLKRKTDEFIYNIKKDVDNTSYVSNNSQSYINVLKNEKTSDLKLYYEKNENILNDILNKDTNLKIKLNLEFDCMLSEGRKSTLNMYPDIYQNATFKQKVLLYSDKKEIAKNKQEIEEKFKEYFANEQKYMSETKFGQMLLKYHNNVKNTLNMKVDSFMYFTACDTYEPDQNGENNYMNLRIVDGKPIYSVEHETYISKGNPYLEGVFTINQKELISKIIELDSTLKKEYESFKNEKQKEFSKEFKQKSNEVSKKYDPVIAKLEKDINVLAITRKDLILKDVKDNKNKDLSR